LGKVTLLSPDILGAMIEQGDPNGIAQYQSQEHLQSYTVMTLFELA
jgi:hypothetical protein